MREAVGAVMLAGCMFLLDQGLNMGGVLDLGALVVTASMTGDFHIFLLYPSASAGGESATALHSQECFLPPRGGFNLRCTRERYIPKNVSFLREEVLIYDAPSLPRKDNLFDQELPSIRGRKCGVKGLVQWHGLMVWSRLWFRTTSPISSPVDLTGTSPGATGFL